MSEKHIQTGKIVNTHGLGGCLKVQPWADSPAVLTEAKCVFIDDTPFKVLSAGEHKNSVLMYLEGVESIESAIRLKNKVISVNREDIELAQGEYFIADLIGLTAIDNETGNIMGTVSDVLTLPGNNVYVIKSQPDKSAGAGRDILIPAVEQFIAETNIDKGYISFNMIEGL